MIESFPLISGHDKIGQFGFVCYFLSDCTLHANADFNEINEVKFAHLNRLMKSSENQVANSQCLSGLFVIHAAAYRWFPKLKNAQ